MIKEYARLKAAKHVKNMIVGDMNASFDPMISLEALPRIQLAISEELDKFCSEFNIDKSNELEFRSCVSLYVQTFVECVVLTLVQMYQPKDALLVGGLFYNVKINSLVQKQLPGRICVMPLAGDQGAGLGVYQHYQGDLIWPGNLNWGARDLNFSTDVPGIEVVSTMAEARFIIETELAETGFVNLVRGNMEFGPRALCNTTTIAYPRISVCDRINQANGRTTEMPLAPFMSAQTADQVFDDCDKVHKSLEYMIVTRDYKPEVNGLYDGAMHYYPDDMKFTGRPQITSDPDLLDILRDNGDVLVNTSFNYHGQPIVMGQDSIEHAHAMQQKNSSAIQIKTVVVTGE